MEKNREKMREKVLALGRITSCVNEYINETDPDKRHLLIREYRKLKKIIQTKGESNEDS